MKLNLLLSAIFTISFFFSACSGLKDIENYKGENLSMGVGDSSSVNMTADTKNGYDWIVAANSDPSIAKYTGKENLTGTNSTDKTTQIIKFKGLKKGKTIITLNYVKKGDMLAKQSRTLNIMVY